MKRPRSTAELLAHYDEVQAAVDRHLTTPTMLGGVLYTPQQLKDHFAGIAAQVIDADDALARYHVAVIVKTRAVRRAAKTLLLIRRALVARHGRGAAEALAEFGLGPPPGRSRAPSQHRVSCPATLRCPSTLPAAKTP